MHGLINIEETGAQSVKRVRGLDLDVHGHEEGREEEHAAGQRHQFWVGELCVLPTNAGVAVLL